MQMTGALDFDEDLQWQILLLLLLNQCQVLFLLLLHSPK